MMMIKSKFLVDQGGKAIKEMLRRVVINEEVSQVESRING